MPKNIVICCDGTWNTPDQIDGGIPAPTNVRLFKLIGMPAAGAGIKTTIPAWDQRVVVG